MMMTTRLLLAAKKAAPSVAKKALPTARKAALDEKVALDAKKMALNAKKMSVEAKNTPTAAKKASATKKAKKEVPTATKASATDKEAASKKKAAPKLDLSGFDVKKPILHVIDASDWIHRCYHASPKWFKSSGRPSGAVMGFTNQLLVLLPYLRPGKDKVVVAFDSGSTWRNNALPSYKKNRPPKDYNLRDQFVPCRNSAASILGEKHCLGIRGLEADDVVAEVVQKASFKKWHTIIHTRDQDIFQLASRKVSIFVPGTGLLDDMAIQERYGVPPKSLPHYWALIGQSSDGISGIPGIGEKMGKSLIAAADYDVDNIWNPEYTKAIKGVYKREDIFEAENQKKLHNFLDLMQLPCARSKFTEHVDWDFIDADFTFKGVDIEKANSFLYDWGLKSARGRLEKLLASA
eukprot:TRINITY_DN6666_c0_g3_i1.p1 TRINITY_DN6666_c0_g3~~TRINITY_DN6666_c0_g3_i1.p1  ORF type:complete len:430 (+),score=97.28 TRINITY_DN6666_c0_g3_i1:74-1291(+)